MWRPSFGKKGRPQLFGRDAKGKSTVSNVAKVAYELFIATVPVDVELHHTCFNELCVKPIHMELLTIAEHKLVHQQMGKRSARGFSHEEITNE